MVRVVGSKIIIKDSDYRYQYDDDYFFYNQWKVSFQYKAERFHFVPVCNSTTQRRNKEEYMI